MPLTDEAMSAFLRTPLGDDLEQVPGITPATAHTLRLRGITNTHRLLGQLLLLRPDRGSKAAYLKSCAQWMQDAGVKTNRADIVHALSEKVEVVLPEVFAFREPND